MTMLKRVRSRLARFGARVQAAALATVAVGAVAAAAATGSAVDDGVPVFEPTPYAPPPTVQQLVIATPFLGEPEYDRNDWSHWQTRKCVSTRNQVLIEEHINEDIEYEPDDRDRHCKVESGQWWDPYGGQVLTDLADIDIDHMVPLRNAHVSGAFDWTAAERKLYANFLEDSQHLIAVEGSLNRKKGAKGPDEWQPPNDDYLCQYAVDWIRVKFAWELTATEEEWDALEEMLDTCDPPPVVVDDEDDE